MQVNPILPCDPDVLMHGHRRRAHLAASRAARRPAARTPISPRRSAPALPSFPSPLAERNTASALLPTRTQTEWDEGDGSRAWFRGCVVKFDATRQPCPFFVKYVDGDSEWVMFERSLGSCFYMDEETGGRATRRVRWLDAPPDPSKNVPEKRKRGRPKNIGVALFGDGDSAEGGLASPASGGATGGGSSRAASPGVAAMRPGGSGKRENGGGGLADVHALAAAKSATSGRRRSETPSVAGSPARGEENVHAAVVGLSGTGMPKQKPPPSSVPAAAHAGTAVAKAGREAAGAPAWSKQHAVADMAATDTGAAKASEQAAAGLKADSAAVSAAKASMEGAGAAKARGEADGAAKARAEAAGAADAPPLRPISTTPQADALSADGRTGSLPVGGGAPTPAATHVRGGAAAGGGRGAGRPRLKPHVLAAAVPGSEAPMTTARSASPQPHLAAGSRLGVDAAMVSAAQKRGVKVLGTGGSAAAASSGAVAMGSTVPGAGGRRAASAEGSETSGATAPKRKATVSSMGHVDVAHMRAWCAWCACVACMVCMHAWLTWSAWCA
eukprot:361274-Chlamydomonas_euryale.AAC.3